MVYIGAFTVALVTLLLWRGYSSYLASELECCRELLVALEDMRDKVRCFLMTPREWAHSYSSDLLEGCGFLGALKDGESPERAYEKCRYKLPVRSDADEVVTNLFRRAGGADLVAEVGAIGIAVDKLSAIESAMSADIGKRVKAAGAMLGAFAAGIVILVI